ncbi:MAG: hypothetical protein MUF29_03615, partial [Chitinophagaceae bacterium]|nr:hypothetical protein [Chitinophagaceae bacterium]
NNQVVAMKGDGTMPGADPGKAVEVFNQLVNKAKTEANANAVESEQDRGRIMPEFNSSSAQPTLPVPPPKPPPNTKTDNPAKPDTADAKPRALMPPKTSTN